MGTEFSGVRTSATSSTETRQVRYVNERIFLYAPQYTPILMLKGGIMPGPNGERIKVNGLIGSKFVPAKKVEWFTKDMPSLTGYISSTTACEPADTGISVDNGSGAVHLGFQAGCLVKVHDEVMFITAITVDAAETRCQVTRGVGATSPAQHAVGSIVSILGNAIEEHSTQQPRRGVQADPQVNYMEISRHDWEVSRSADKIRLYGGKDKAETMAEAAVQHVCELERKITFGAKANNLTLNSKTVQSSGGFMEFCPNVYRAVGLTSSGEYASASRAAATVKYGEFVETFMLKAFKYSSPRRRKMFVAGSVFGKVFGRFSTNVGNIQTFNRDTAFGVQVTEVLSPAGTLEYLTSGAIEEAEAGLGLLFDPDFLTWCYLDNTFMVENSQAKGTDGYGGYFLTEACMMFEAPKTLAAIRDVTGWATE